MSAIRQFKTCAVRYGDKIVGGIAITCGACGLSMQKPRGSSKTFVGPSEESRRYRAMFEREGWEVADRPQDDRCPCCLGLKSIEAASRKKLTVVQSKEPISMSTPATASKPREMSPADGRIIIAKLDDVYDTSAQCFSAPWTDQRVATDLGVPRAWVEQVRKQFYGPEGSNPEITQAMVEAKQHLGLAKELLAKIEGAKATMGSLVAEAQKLTARGEMIERKLATVEKAVRP